MSVFLRCIRLNLIVGLLLLSLGLLPWIAMPFAWAQGTLVDPLIPTTELQHLPDAALDANNIPTEKVTQFVRACLQVIKLIERREIDLQTAETDTDATRIEQEIEAAALSVIEKNGLTRQEYLQLLGLANTDPEFGERVAVQLQEMNR